MILGRSWDWFEDDDHCSVVVDADDYEGKGDYNEDC